MLTDWWGFCWMILAEKRGLLTPENRAAARAAIEEKYLAAPNVIGVIVGRERKIGERENWLRSMTTNWPTHAYPSLPLAAAARR